MAGGRVYVTPEARKTCIFVCIAHELQVVEMKIHIFISKNIHLTQSNTMTRESRGKTRMHGQCEDSCSYAYCKTWKLKSN